MGRIKSIEWSLQFYKKKIVGATEVVTYVTEGGGTLQDFTGCEYLMMVIGRMEELYAPLGAVSVYVKLEACDA